MKGRPGSGTASATARPTSGSEGARGPKRAVEPGRQPRGKATMAARTREVANARAVRQAAIASRSEGRRRSRSPSRHEARLEACPCRRQAGKRSQAVEPPAWRTVGTSTRRSASGVEEGSARRFEQPPACCWWMEAGSPCRRLEKNRPDSPGGFGKDRPEGGRSGRPPGPPRDDERGGTGPSGRPAGGSRPGGAGRPGGYGRPPGDRGSTRPSGGSGSGRPSGGSNRFGSRPPRGGKPGGGGGNRGGGGGRGR